MLNNLPYALLVDVQIVLPGALIEPQCVLFVQERDRNRMIHRFDVYI